MLITTEIRLSKTKRGNFDIFEIDTSISESKGWWNLALSADVHVLLRTVYNRCRDCLLSDAAEIRACINLDSEVAESISSDLVAQVFLSVDQQG